MRSYWIAQMGPKYNNKSLEKTEEIQTHRGEVT